MEALLVAHSLHKREVPGSSPGALHLTEFFFLSVNDDIMLACDFIFLFTLEACFHQIEVN